MQRIVYTTTRTPYHPNARDRVVSVTPIGDSGGYRQLAVVLDDSPPQAPQAPAGDPLIALSPTVGVRRSAVTGYEWRPATEGDRHHATYAAELEVSVGRWRYTVPMGEGEALRIIAQLRGE